MADPRQTPAMQQYYRFKERHPGCVLFFRMGDFYEMFDDDAVAVSRALGLTLTERTAGVPMAGVPYHQLETYLRRMLEHGFRVAVCEQVQDPKEAKGVVERAVTRVVTPGTLVDEELVSDDSATRLGAVCFTGEGEDSPASVGVVDLASGRMQVFDADSGSLPDELARRGVTELLYAETADGAVPRRVQRVLDALGVAGTARPSWHFRLGEAREALLEQFAVATLEGFGLRDDEDVLRPAGALVRYLIETQAPRGGEGERGSAQRVLRHVHPPKRDHPGSRLVIDAITLRALEVLGTMRSGRGLLPSGGDHEGSLLGVFLTGGRSARGGARGSGKGSRGCATPMGKRLLRDWLCQPLCARAEIEARQRCVEALVGDRVAAGSLADALAGVQDVSRIAARLSLGRATARDLVALARSLGQIRALEEVIESAPAFSRQASVIGDVRVQLEPLAERIASSCVESPPAHMRDGGLIRDGVDAQLDEARSLQRDGASWLAAYQKRLLEEHSLPGLKVGYNKVFGYYIELTSAQAKRAPGSFIRKQTLKGAERYITPELKEFEEKVTTARARAVEREQRLFEKLCADAAACAEAIQCFAEAAAELDVLCCFASKAHARAWTRPRVVDEPVLRIVEGRHPVLDELLGGNFVPNDIELGSGGQTLALITGPNMSGKSTFIRQSALIVLLAHTGSFVPASEAVVGLTDRVFTRIGADDALHAGQSTFMVEMTETARILHHCSARSVVILDEIGRGTSTLDGLALAWAVAETLIADGLRCRTLFATHYHELTDLSDNHPERVRNLHVTVREWGDRIVFMHRIEPGRADRSYGIHVARLAGLPARTIERAQEILESLAVHHGPAAHPPGKNAGAGPAPSPPDGQLPLFTEFVPHPAVERLKELDIERLSPLEAFDQLRRLRRMLEERE